MLVMVVLPLVIGGGEAWAAEWVNSTIQSSAFKLGSPLPLLLLLLLQARLPRKFPEPDNQGGEEGGWEHLAVVY